MYNELPRKTEKPWGFELLFAHNSKYAGKVIFVKKGHRLSLQYHDKKDECIYLHEGKALADIEESDGNIIKITLEAGQRLPVSPHTRHRLEALEDTIFFEVSTPEMEDVVRLEDDYGRIT